MTSHPCAVPSCKAEVPLERLMCFGHWRAVPMRLRTALWEAYIAGQEDDLSLVMPEYLDARRACIEAVRPAGSKSQ